MVDLLIVLSKVAVSWNGSNRSYALVVSLKLSVSAMRYEGLQRLSIVVPMAQFAQFQLLYYVYRGLANLCSAPISDSKDIYLGIIHNYTNLSSCFSIAIALKVLGSTIHTR